MAFARHFGRMLFDDGLDQVRAGHRYLMLSGSWIDLTGLGPARRLALERCLGMVQGSRTYNDLLSRLADKGDVAAALALIPPGGTPSPAELKQILRDIIWRRGLRDGCELFDAPVARRWMMERLGEVEKAAAPVPAFARRAPARRAARESVIPLVPSY